jgi:hypothetical protein
MAKIMDKKRSNIARVDPDFIKEIKELAKFRYLKNLEKKEPSTSEMTRLLRKTHAWQQAQTELRIKPRKEDLI